MSHSRQMLPCARVSRVLSVLAFLMLLSAIATASELKSPRAPALASPPLSGDCAAQFTRVWSATETYSTQDLAWADYDSDGDLDLALGNVGSPDVVYRNDGSSMSIAWVSPVPANSGKSSVAWGDFDADSDYDLAIGGDEGRLVVYRNDSTMPLVLTEAWSTPDTGSISIAWADADRDGDVDLFAGENNFPAGGPVRLYRNDGGMPLQMTPVWSSPELSGTNSIAVADYDNDGDPDVAVGTNKLGPSRNRVYRNDGGNVPNFTLVWAVPDSEYTWEVHWGDYDGDGDLDLGFAGGDLLSEPSASIYRNDGGDPLSLTRVYSAPSTDHGSSFSWGDYDGDGDLDFAVNSCTCEPSDWVRLYCNDGRGSFVPHDFTNERHGDLESGDWDDDGDLDLAIGGEVSVFENQR